MKKYADACKRKVPKKDKAKFEKYIGCRKKQPQAHKRLIKQCAKAVTKKPTKTLEKKKLRCRGSKKNKNVQKKQDINLVDKVGVILNKYHLDL